jgi:magnesium chelatase subunit D
MVARRALAFQAGPDHFIEDYVAATALEAARVSTARQLLQDVTVGPDARRQLCERASELGVEGNRTEVFALHTARAHAALRGHGEVEECDVRAASELVIEPRARTTVEGARSSRAPLGQGTTSTPAPTRGGAAGEWRAPPIDNPVPALTWPARATGAGATAGGRMRRRAESEAGRGRYVGALETDPGHGTVAVDATLRAAAPFQQVRQSDGRQLRILAGDLRYKRFRRKTGVGIVIALDASGSMANNRIQQAKGAIIRLLREVYVHRDSVALVAFRGDRAELLMKLGRSVELARRALDDLPAGGGTPLASGILCALDETRHTTVPTLLVLLTDGKPNVSGTGEPVWVELERVAQAVRQSKSVPIVIDTSRGHPSSERLAAMLDAKYLVLPRMDAAAVYQRVSEAASAMR